MKAAGKWFNLGLALKVSYDTLDNIRDKHGDNQNCLREMLAARLKTGPLTYSEICQSLRAPTVERNDVAEAIEEACTGMNSDTISISMDRLRYVNAWVYIYVVDHILIIILCTL